MSAERKCVGCGRKEAPGAFGGAIGRQAPFSEQPQGLMCAECVWMWPDVPASLVVKPGVCADQTVIRTARKDHRCAGPPGTDSRCPHGDIAKGTRYAEYLGESHAYQSGARYCPACAVAQGVATIATNS